MADLANLVLAVDSTSVPKATASLDGLTAAGARAEAATVGLRGGFKGAGVEAAAMASAAQLSARAAMDQAAGFGAATNAARVNTLAMRETLVVAREISRGNFTRLPGSLTLLAQGVGSQGGFGAYASALLNTLGIVRKVQDAELAESAAAAASAATAVRAAAQRAGANILAAYTEVALAEAQVRVAEGSAAEATAQARLAAAHEAVAAAAAEATVAENALAVAQGRATEAAATSAAATRTVIGSGGIGLIGIAVATAGAIAGFEALKQHVADTGVLQSFAESLGLSAQQLDKLKDKTNDFALTFGDVWNGLKQTIADGLDNNSGWQSFKRGAYSAATAVMEAMTQADAFIVGHVNAAYDTIVQQWSHLPQVFGDVFISAANAAIEGLNFLLRKGADGLNSFIASVKPLLEAVGISAGKVGAPQIGGIANPYAGSAQKFGQAAKGNVQKDVAARLAEDRERNANFYNNIISAAEDRIKGDAPNAPKAKKPKKPRENPADNELDKLNAEIAAENALTKAYLTSDAAVIRAEANQKAMVLAVEKHANAAQTAALKDKELALAIATIAGNGAKAINNLTFEAESRKHVNDMVAQGLVPASQANVFLQLETQLRPLVAARAVAEGAAKRQLTSEIVRLTKAYQENQAQLNISGAQAQIAANDNEIEQLKLKNQLLGHSNEEIARALANLQTMQYLKDHPGIDSSTAADLANTNVQKALLTVQSPFQQWAATVPQTANAINDALQSIEFKGFDSLASAIGEVVTGTKSLGSAFRDIAHQIIADIIQMTVKMLIFKALTSVFGGGGGGLFGGSGGGGGGAFGSALAGARASGGSVDAGQSYLVGEKGPEVFRPSSPGTIIPNGGQTNDNRSGPIEIKIGFGPAPDFAPYVQQVAGAAAGHAVSISVDHTNRTLKSLARTKLNGG